MFNVFRFFFPPKQWRVPAVLVVGLAAGLITYALYIGNAVSYLSDDPRACMNCHVMAPQYATWERSSHARVAVCNDCHVPQNNFVRKYLFKAQDGLRHATMFTLRMEPQVIHIKEAGMGAVQENCIRCHSHMNSLVSTTKTTVEAKIHGGDRLCWDCHREVPHGRVNSLASTPYARVPRLSPVVPQWIENILK